jgi:hypothetical protein
VPAQAADHVAKTASEPTALIHELAVLYTPLILADKHLRQLHLNEASVAPNSNPQSTATFHSHLATGRPFNPVA